MAAIRPAAAAGSATAAVASALLVLLAAAAVCSGSSTATGDEAELIASTGSMSITTRGQVVVPAMYVFGDSLVDAGNNDFLPAPAPKAMPPNGVDLPRTILWRTGRFTNAYNLADIIAQHVGFRRSPRAYLSLTPLSWLDLLRGRVGTNYASGGSGILDVTGNGTITLREQVALFAKTKAAILRAGLVGRESLDGLLGRSLFVISTGGNDFGVFVDPGGVPLSRAPEFMAGMVADYLNYINELGGWSCSTSYPSDACRASDGECDGDGNYLSELFNSLLRVETAKAVTTSVPAMRYSIASLYNVLTDMIANPTLAGLREVKTACCGSGRFNGEVECSVDTNLCADRDEYLFWDTVHGTQAAYRRAVRAFFYGTTREAEPINLHQLLQDEQYYSAATARYSSI
ncbi:unnamed protein product [Miscanthus lutarioriparius]|uniref:GDSL esterase/lipase n=1 Tax=Miscanthus lutarioriparius TaxID=422564 RepID=A0A811RJ28_9POAL|nr:unnamed protein product [Miscanthus lutarioriparius]